MTLKKDDNRDSHTGSVNEKSRRYSVSHSGKYKQKHKVRKSIDQELFKEDSNNKTQVKASIFIKFLIAICTNILFSYNAILIETRQILTLLHQIRIKIYAGD